jgi:ferredoxin-NADP reductase
VWTFFVAAAVSIGVTAASGPIGGIAQALAHAPVFFFAFVMLTEPLTTPPTRLLRIAYGALVGVLFAPAIHIGSLYSTPELALLVGNIFSYAVSPKWKSVLRLTGKEEVAHDVYDFVFRGDRPLAFRPGQYLEWTYKHPRADSRGNRRYFTIASSPTERDIRIGVKFYDRASSFKKSMLGMRPGDTIIASQLAGDFTLPRSQKKKLVFIAGGIGITPFRSMIKYITDAQQRRTVTLLYSVRVPQDIAYADIFEEASRAWGLKTVYAVTDADSVLPGWIGQRGAIDAACIKREVPDWRDRVFYLSGPHSMVVAFEVTLCDMGVARRNIKTDFFPGFA